MAVLVLGSPGSADANETRWYAGLGVGSSSADYDTSSFTSDMAARGHTVTNVSIDDSDTSFKIYGGLNWGKYLGGELAYVDLGETEANFDAQTNSPQGMVQDANELLPVLGSGVALSAIGRYPFGDRGAIFARLGAYFWEADLTINTTGDVTGSAEQSTDGTDVLFGLGGELYFPEFLNGRLGLRAEWERYNLDNNDVDLLSASLLLRF